MLYTYVCICMKFGSTILLLHMSVTFTNQDGAFKRNSSVTKHLRFYSFSFWLLWTLHMWLSNSSMNFWRAINNYQVAEHPDDGSTTTTSSTQQLLVETALLACIEFLEAQLEKLQNDDKSTDQKKSQPFSIHQSKHDDHEVSIILYRIFIFCCIFGILQFLGPAVANFITGEPNQMLESGIVLQSLF